MHTTSRFPQLSKDGPSSSRGCRNRAVSMCNETAILNYCPVLLEYIWLRKALRNTQNKMVMEMGPYFLTQQIICGLLGSMSIMPGTCIYSSEAVQAKFSANLLEFCGLGTLTEEHSSPSLTWSN